MTAQTAGRGARHKPLAWVAAFIVLAAAAFAVTAGRRVLRGSGDEGKQPLFEVAEGPLTISVTESGTVQPRDRVVIKSEVEGTTTILYVIPEGTQVKKGDLLVQLDASKLEDAKVDQEIRAQNAKAAFIGATENLEVVRNQAQSDTDEAELRLRFAQEDLKNYRDAEYPNQEKELEVRITLAQMDLERAEDELYWSDILSKEKYLSEAELRADKLAVEKAKLDLDLAQNNLALLKDCTYKRTLDELDSDVKQAGMAQERTRRKATADVVQAAASLRAKDSESTREQGKLTKTEEQIVKTRIAAPTDGIVVYATSTQVSWRGNIAPLEEGKQVREREELIHLPTGTAFMAEVKVHESSLEKVRPGLPVRIAVDALPGKTFEGKVASIAPLPDGQSMFMNPDLKLYRTQIHIEGGADVLRSGVTCKAEIIVEQHRSAVYVPVQSVVRVEGQTTAFVKNGDRFEPRPVEIGLDNNRMVRIVSGLTPGEMVLLTPPLAASAAVREEGGETELEAPGTDKPTRDVPTVVPRETNGEQTGPLTERQAPGPERSQGDDRPPSGGGEDLTPEERQRLRERFESMSPEEREAMRRQRQQGQQAD